MKRGAFVAFIATMVFTGVMQPVVAAPAHYFVVSENAAGELSIVSHRIVDIDGIEQSSLPHPAYSLFEQTLTIEVVSKRSNAVAFKSATTASPWIRGEFHDSPHQSGVGHNIKGHIVPEQERTYVVRVPSTSDQVLKLRKLVPIKGGISSAALGAGALDIDLDRIEQSAVAPSALPAGYDAGTVLDNGPLSNRLDLLIMGDGYTAAQRETFIADATNLANAFLNISPYRDFKQLINVHWLFVPSNQSGADKPACAETPGSAVIAVDTAFDATFCTSGIRRLVTVNGTKVVNAAAAVPGWDAIMVIVNDTEYGGSGGTRSVITKAAAAVEIAQHEFGHSFSRLADEYTTAFPSFPACSDVTGTTACQSNVTDQTDRALVKWNAWIANTTPVPTTNPVAGDNRAAGLWEGARYLEQGMYRQCFNGAMRSLGAPFCKVDSEAFVKRLYAPTGAGWGVPSAGVSLIDPMSTPLGPTLAAQPNQPMTFRARVAGSTNPLTVEWRVDGILLQSGTALHGEHVEFTRNAPENGAVTVELKVIDSTSFLLAPHSNTRGWSVSVGAHVLNVAKFGSGTVTSAPAGLSCGTVCSQAYASATNVTLSASPTSGSKFVGWLGDCTGSATSCAVNVNGARQTTAVFAPNASVASLDIDGNGRLEAHADGLLAMRYFMLGALRMQAKGAVGTLAQRTSAATTTQHLERMLPALDIDGDGVLNTSVDGVLIVRYMLGFRGDSLMAEVAIGANATRTTSSLIENHLLGLMIPN